VCLTFGGPTVGLIDNFCLKEPAMTVVSDHKRVIAAAWNQDLSHVRGYGWRRQLPDVRDMLYTARLKDLPPDEADLRPSMPPVYDQGQLGSCTGNAIAGVMEYERNRQGLSDFVPSRLFIYYNERALEGTVSSDAGAVIRDGIKVVNSDGVCPESLWPYNIGMFSVKPPKRCYVSAEADKAVQYLAVQTLGDLKDAISSKLAVAFGFTVHKSFESAEVARTGIMPMPEPGDPTVGGHAVVAVGYSDPKRQLVVRNSWGSSWGDGGYFYMPYQYITGSQISDDSSPINGAHLASDFWAIQMVSS
jgi:C1A family cysteine protease